MLQQQPLRQRRTRSELSYKFQRLREKIRQAVASGELAGKLPGERELARHFHVNAKTLSKALTDLAAEGLLSRSIGRGTFVKGCEVEPAVAMGPWLLICDSSAGDCPLVQTLQARNPEARVLTDVGSIRPSFLNQFAAVVDLASSTPEELVRDWVVRNIPLVLVNREPRSLSSNAVLLDSQYLAGRLGRDLMMSGHNRLAVIGTGDCSNVVETIRITAARYAPQVTVKFGTPDEAAGLVEQGVTGLICDSTTAAVLTMDYLHKASIPTPGAASVVAFGLAEDSFPCTGFYVSPGQMADAIVHLLNSSVSGRPSVLWMTGRLVDQKTTWPMAADTDSVAAQPLPILTLTA
jgi:Bacterial regulatory proteins, gntR family